MIAKLSPGFYLCVTDKNFNEKYFKSTISYITHFQILTIEDIKGIKQGFDLNLKSDNLKCIQVTNIEEFEYVTRVFINVTEKSMDCPIMVIIDFDLINNSLWLYKNMYTPKSPYRRLYKITSDEYKFIDLYSSIKFNNLRKIDKPLPFSVLFYNTSAVGIESLLSKKKYYSKLINEKNDILDVLFIKEYSLKDASEKANFISEGRELYRIETVRLRDRDFISR